MKNSDAIVRLVPGSLESIEIAIGIMMTLTEDISAPIATDLVEVIARFDAELASDLPFVNELVERVRGYRGKLLRPKLLLLAAQAAGGIRDEHLTLAAVVEMVHMATLVHDDVLDEADVRRRSVTINRMSGNEAAVMLGDFLISHAYHLCSSIGSTDAARRVAAVTNTVCEGELMQIHHRRNLGLSERDYFQIIERKTASLTGLCCELGARWAAADDTVVGALASYGRDIGIAFQIVDDLLDLTGSQQETGKSVGRDTEMGKLTLPLIRFRNSVDSGKREQLDEILSNGHEDKAALARAMLVDSGCIEQAFDVARDYIDRAVAALAVLPPTDAKAALTAAADFVVQRRA